MLTAYLATRTSTIRFVTTVMIPCRPPFAVAKQIARSTTYRAAASGWPRRAVGLEREFEMLRVSYEPRGAITDEYLRAMRAPRTKEWPEFHGVHVSFSEISFVPKCCQVQRAPIWVTGDAARGPVKRCLELGWMPMGGGLDDRLRETVVRLK